MAEDLGKRLSDAIKRAALGSTGLDGVAAVQPVLAQMFGLQASEVFAVFVPSLPMLRQIVQDFVPHRKTRLLLVVLGQAGDLEAASHQLALLVGSSRALYSTALCVMSRHGEWHVPTIICRNSDGLGARIRDCLNMSAKIIEPASQGLATRSGGWSSASDALILDDRILRMARLSLASSPAVVFVGPPGTGKTTLIRKLLEEVTAAPERFGLSRPPKDPKWVTPSEDWTALDLVGGKTTDQNGQKSFRPGHLLDAIRQDRWLILDEVNRANMDRIFGAALTWLSGQSVELGQMPGSPHGPPIVLDWNIRPECQTVRAELLGSDKIATPEAIRFLAGTDWRLLGTYNGRDAQKLFEFGQALGRRFLRVPIPMISPGQFARALAPLVKDLPAEVGKAILGIYTAHYRTPLAHLGAAIFLQVAFYVKAGMKLSLITDDTAVVSRPGAEDTSTTIQLVAEAYVCLAGMWLAQMPPERLTALGKALLQTGFPEGEWNWIVQLLSTLV